MESAAEVIIGGARLEVSCRVSAASFILPLNPLLSLTPIRSACSVLLRVNIVQRQLTLVPSGASGLVKAGTRGRGVVTDTDLRHIVDNNVI